MTYGILKSIREREKMFEKLKRQPNNIELENNYKQYRNYVKTLIRITKHSYYEQEIKKYKHDIKNNGR